MKIPESPRAIFLSFGLDIRRLILIAASSFLGVSLYMTMNNFKTLNEIKVNNKNLASRQKQWLDIEQTISEKF
jgi:hypothetical protein